MSTHDPNPSVDEGTTTGAPTALLTRALSGAFLAGRAAASGISRVAVVLEAATRIAGATIRTLTSPVEVVARLCVHAFGAVSAVVFAVGTRVGARVELAAAALGAACRTAAHSGQWIARLAAAFIARQRWLTRVLSGIVACLAILIALPAAVAAQLGLTIAAHAFLLAVSMIVAYVTFWAALPVVAVSALCALAPVLRVVGGLSASALERLWRWTAPAARFLARLTRAACKGYSRIVERVVDWVRRTVAPRVARIASACAGLAHAAWAAYSQALHGLLRWFGRSVGSRTVRAARACARGARAAWAEYSRTVGHVTKWLARVASPVRRALRHVVSMLGAIVNRLRLVAERIGRDIRSGLQWCVRYTAFTRDRVALAGGVALARARVRTANVPTTTLVAPGHRPVAPRDVTEGFTASVFQNEYLPAGAREVHAVICVTSSVERDERSPDAAVAILLDCSGSMGRPWSRLQAARQATAAAVDTLADGTWFAIVRGSDRAEVAYPPSGELVRSTAETRLAAKRALRALWPEGGTAMGRWLLTARDLFATRPAVVASAILLTDGRNESESKDALDAALDACAGRFQCDCRGVGTDWSVDELRTIATQLLGTIDAVPAPELLTADFEAMAAAAMSRGVGEVWLDVQTPVGGPLLHLSQVAPEWIELCTRKQTDARMLRFSTGAWGSESRDYQVSVRLPAGEVGDEMLAARVSVVVDRRVAAELQVKAIWCEDEQLSTSVHPAVSHYDTQAQLVATIGRGLEARASGDWATATSELGRAAQLADASEHDATMRLLQTVVDVEDAMTGVVRMKSAVDPIEAMTLDARSTRTSTWRGHGDPEAQRDGGGQ